MPTPFMHLQIAERIRRHPLLEHDVDALLASHWPAFYAGSIAADYQTICNIPRENTHFYDLPPATDAKPCRVMFAGHPHLAEPAELSPAHAVFIAAYCAHLMLDVRWFHEVLMPFFVAAADWNGDRRERYLVHNVLLTYLDRLALDSLPAGAADTLARADMSGRLPFALDDDLRRWQKMLVDQLRPGAAVQTVSIYAERLRMTPEAFAARLADETWMADVVFRRAPLELVQAMLTDSVRESVALITSYLHPLRNRRLQSARDT